MNEDEAFRTEDGTDPKKFHDRRRLHRQPRQTVAGRKALQLCGQVKDSLHGILAGCADEVVRNLTALMVEPAPHTGRLMVTVAGPGPADATDPATVANHLARAVPRGELDLIPLASLPMCGTSLTTEGIACGSDRRPFWPGSR